MSFSRIQSVSKEMSSMIGFVTVDDYDVFVIEYAFWSAQWFKSNPHQAPLTPKKRLPEVLDLIARETKKHSIYNIPKAS